jgi:hypothetical protein
MGAAEEGKSTIFRALKNHFGVRFNEDEKVYFTQVLSEQYRTFVKNISLSAPISSQCIQLKELMTGREDGEDEEKVALGVNGGGGACCTLSSSSTFSSVFDWEKIGHLLGKLLILCSCLSFSLRFSMF